MLKKLTSLSFGRLVIVDRSNTFIFGDQHSELHATLTVTSQEFYVFLGSGGVTGVAEAYMAGYWTADNLVLLLQIVLKNKNSYKDFNDKRFFNYKLHW